MAAPITKPSLDTVPAGYHKYLDMLPETDLLELLDETGRAIQFTIRGVREDQGDFRYAEGKWSIKELVLHIIDTERIFCYRALRFARGDGDPVRGFDENLYAANSDADRRTVASLVEEFHAVRESTIQLFKHLPARSLDLIGIAPQGPCSVNGMGWILCGHALHHSNVLMERYLAKLDEARATYA